MAIDEKEIWRPISGYPNYEVSSLGRVKSIKREPHVILRPADDGCGYNHVVLYKEGGQKTTFKVHRLVATFFVKNVYKKETVNHKDGDKKNNHYNNLEWATRSENTLHKYAIGLDSNKGEKHPSSKLTPEQVMEIRKRYELGETDRAKLGAYYNISPSHIYSIVKYISWNHLQ